MNKFNMELLMKYLFLGCASISIMAVGLICIFLFANGIPAMQEIGILNFLTGDVWRPSANEYGVYPMIVASLYVTAGAIIIGVPLGVLSAIYMAKYCSERTYRYLKPAINLLSGVPSVVYGFFGLMVIVPLIRYLFDGSGASLLAASIVLGIMILPTIIGISESAIRAVPDSYYESSLALGATRERSIFKVVLPAAKSGIMTAIILGIGRSIGETMAVVMVAGNQPILPRGLTDGIRTLTGNIVLEMGYAQDLHRDALIATAVVLFVFILIINICLNIVKEGGKKC